MAKPFPILKDDNGWWMQWAVLHAFNEVCHWTPFARLVQSVGVEGFGRLVRPLTESAVAELKTRQSYGHTAYRNIYPILAQELKARYDALVVVWAFDDDINDLILVSLAYHPELDAHFEVKRWNAVLEVYRVDQILKIIEGGGSLEDIEGYISLGLDTSIINDLNQ